MIKLGTLCFVRATNLEGCACLRDPGSGPGLSQSSAAEQQQAGCACSLSLNRSAARLRASESEQRSTPRADPKIGALSVSSA